MSNIERTLLQGSIPELRALYLAKKLSVVEAVTWFQSRIQAISQSGPLPDSPCSYAFICSEANVAVSTALTDEMSRGTCQPPRRMDRLVADAEYTSLGPACSLRHH